MNNHVSNSYLIAMNIGFILTALPKLEAGPQQEEEEEKEKGDE